MRRDVKRSEKAICDAYIELCAKKGHDHVMVSDIIKVADVSRSTFYAHYEDIRQLEKEMAEIFVSRAMNIHMPQFPLTKEALYNSILDVFTVFREHANYVQAAGCSFLFEACTTRLKEEIDRSFHIILDKEQRKQIQQMIAMLITGTALYLVEHREADINSYAKTTTLFILDGMQGSKE